MPMGRSQPVHRWNSARLEASSGSLQTEIDLVAMWILQGQWEKARIASHANARALPHSPPFWAAFAAAAGGRMLPSHVEPMHCTAVRRSVGEPTVGPILATATDAARPQALVRNSTIKQHAFAPLHVFYCGYHDVSILLHQGLFDAALAAIDEMRT